MIDSTKRTALHYATLANRPDVVNICIEHGESLSLSLALFLSLALSLIDFFNNFCTPLL